MCISKISALEDGAAGGAALLVTAQELDAFRQEWQEAFRQMEQESERLFQEMKEEMEERVRRLTGEVEALKRRLSLYEERGGDWQGRMALLDRRVAAVEAHFSDSSAALEP